MKHYDYIFSGAGLSALMTVYRMLLTGKFSEKSILLVDSNPKKSNDRTWCFWEKPDGEWENIVSEKWDLALFAAEGFKRDLDLKPYQYKKINGIDFYTLVFDVIEKHPNVTFVNEKITDFSEAGNDIIVSTESRNFTGSKLFNSILKIDEVQNQSKFPLLQQHFIGWFIKSEIEIFNPEQVTFMDFSVQQKGNTRFMYVLPTSKTEALVEYTLFSEDLLPEDEYENAIENYIAKLDVTNYEILKKERGSIPMTVFPFWKNNTKNILHIGSAGGWTKASTGYTFKNSDKKSKALVAFLQTENDLAKFHKPNRFRFYDRLLLDILDQKNETGSEIFSSLFACGNPAPIFKFLDEETSFLEDLQIIWKCPKKLFINALINRIT